MSDDTVSRLADEVLRGASPEKFTPSYMAYEGVRAGLRYAAERVKSGATESCDCVYCRQLRAAIEQLRALAKEEGGA